MRRHIGAFVLLCLLLLSIGAGATADDPAFRLDWQVVASGGGSSAGGGFQIQGSIGQPAVSVLRGGAYVLRGGFWQGEGSPLPAYWGYLPVVLKRY
jgi:hypothetical protein